MTYYSPDREEIGVTFLNINLNPEKTFVSVLNKALFLVNYEEQNSWKIILKEFDFSKTRKLSAEIKNERCYRK